MEKVKVSLPEQTGQARQQAVAVGWRKVPAGLPGLPGWGDGMWMFPTSWGTQNPGRRPGT